MYVVLILIVVAIVLGPSLWVKRVLAKHGKNIPTMPGTGGELADHLIKRFGLGDVKVEQTELGDHYDDNDKMVRLTAPHFQGKSLSAIAVAAHEVGHAIQFHRNEPIARLRKRLTPAAITVERVAIFILMAAPAVAAVLKVPQSGLLIAAVGVIAMLSSVFIQLLVLPLEFDASFNKALPILIDGEYITDDQVEAVREVLRAAAWTYVAGTLASLLRF
ncbi:zinc metallopeptidase, partial [Oleiphilus sp. HI0066]